MAYGFEATNIVLKSPDEIEIMKANGGILKDVMRRLVARVKPGCSTLDLDKMAYYLITSSGATPAFLGYKNYPATICTSINEQVVHGIPSNRKLVSGDLLSIDVGLFKDGFFSDKAVTIPVGEIGEASRNLLEVTKQALEIGTEYCREGYRLGDLSSAIEEFVISRGFSVVKEYTGHGIGRQIHEPPQIPNFGKKNTGPRLKEGMVLALEPMVNAGGYKTCVLVDKWTVVTEDRKYSAHFENTVAVTSDKALILT